MSRFAFTWHPHTWVFGFTIEPGGYIYLYLVVCTVSVHLGRGR